MATNSGSAAAQSIRTTSVRRPMTGLLTVLFAASLLSFLLPDIALDTTFADMVVRLTDTGTWPLLAVIALMMVLALTLRPEYEARRRVQEALALALILPIALAGNGLLNEHVVKPAFGVPRPNIVELAENGVLGPEILDAESFYATGDKQARRDVLDDRLTPESTPYLSPTVRAHWIHETGYSFPSGHATASVTFAILMAAVGLRWLGGWRRTVAVYAIPLWAIAVVYSRPLLGVHRPIDVIAGTLAGFLWGILSFAIVWRVVERTR